MIIEKYDNHKLQTWRLCPLKGFWRHERHLVQSAQEKSAALEYGIHLHKALDTLYTDKDQESAADLWLESYTPVFEELELYDPTAEKHTPEMGASQIKDYWNYWEESIHSMEVLGIEQYFALDLGLDDERQCPIPHLDRRCVVCSGTGVVRGPIYCGVVDKVFKDKRSGQVVGMDHKTTSMLTSALINSYKISHEFRGYVYWLKRQSQWKEECGEYFYFDLLLKTRSLKYAEGAKFYRDTTLCQEPFLDEWWDDMIHHVKEIRIMRKDAEEGIRYPRQDSDACQKFGRLCAYYDLCSQPREMRDTLAEQLYDIDQWDPLKRDEEVVV